MGEGEWELRLGVDRVAWGGAEDLDHSGRVFGFEAKRRLDDNWLLELEGTAFHGVRWAGDVLYGVRRDSFIGLSLVYNL